MIESEAKVSRDQQKQQIRERYKGVNPDVLTVIPAKKPADFYDDDPRRVAVYVRVSTDDPRQTSSFELQKNYYEDIVERHPNWTLVGIYPDEGISGTSLNHRDNFNRMIEDCKQGKIDLIITKSVSRFARNIVDCISIVRQLSSLRPQVGVFFETEHIFTLKDNTEMSLSFTATMAQEESHVKSSIMNASIEMRFSHGIVLTPVLLGYDKNDDGELVINPDEARTVRLIFFMYLYGYTCSEIADALMELQRRTKKGRTKWSASTVLNVLRNERHCGDVLARKTWTPSYLDHKAKKNNGDRNQYRWPDHHEPIISRDDFIAVQRLLQNAKYGNKGILPEIHVIEEGALQGFVLIHPKWAGFKAPDYIKASESAGTEEPEEEEELQIEAQAGDFDFRGFEIARSQFFDTQQQISVMISVSQMKFSSYSVSKLEKVQYVEFLIHPAKKLLVVRPSVRNCTTSVRWYTTKDGNISTSPVSGAAYLGTIFEIFGWKPELKYKFRGVRRGEGKDAILMYDLSEEEIFIPNDSLEMPEDEESNPILQRKPADPIVKTGKSVCAFPAEWISSFGYNFYRRSQAAELCAFDENGNWRLNSKGRPFPLDNPPLQVTSRDEARTGINNIVNEIKSEEQTQ